MTNSEILIYQSSDGNIKIDVRLEEETVWLTQAQLCELFQKSKATISEYIKNVFEEGELDEKFKVTYLHPVYWRNSIFNKKVIAFTEMFVSKKSSRSRKR